MKNEIVTITNNVGSALSSRRSTYIVMGYSDRSWHRQGGAGAADGLDELLEVIEKAIDGQAELARTNSDEFAISRSGDEAGILVRHIARKILEAVSEPLAVQSWRIKVGVSIGLAVLQIRWKRCVCTTPARVKVAPLL